MVLIIFGAFLTLLGAIGGNLDKWCDKPWNMASILGMAALGGGIFVTICTGCNSIKDAADAKRKYDSVSLLITSKEDSIKQISNKLAIKSDTLESLQRNEADSTKSVLVQGNKMLRGLDNSIKIEKNTNGTSSTILGKSLSMLEGQERDSSNDAYHDSVDFWSAYQKI